jgi:ABC-type uncharacterized transport system substrate-binding protein
MKKETIFLSAAVSIFLIILFLYLIQHYEIITKDQYETAPVIKTDGKRWRIGYYEGGPYTDYQTVLKSTIIGLMQLGWIEKADIPNLPDNEDTKTMWEWLSKTGNSDYIQFVEDAYWSSGWNDKIRAVNKDRIIKRLAMNRDIDLMIAMGTWAGQDLANNDHSVPTVVMSTSDPVLAKIIKSPEYSGYDHVHARCDPTRYIRQVRLFHDIFGFKKLGIVYEDTEVGRIYVNLEDIKTVAAQRGFEVIPCHAPEDINELDECVKKVSECYKKLAPQIDALFISYHRGENAKYMPELLEPIFEYKIPAWSTKGLTHVKRGVLMSIAKENFDALGMFEAETTAKIFNGAIPGKLEQVFKNTLKIAINLETARRIGYNPPANILKVADIIYETIESGPIE